MKSFLPLAKTLLPILGLAAASSTFGAIRGPYTNDANTVILLHLDEPALKFNS